MKISRNDALHQLKESGQLFLNLFEHGTLQVEIYKPQEVDLQTPHERDEVYIIANGTGTFVLEGKKEGIKAGDFIFVAAGKEHRFEDFSIDFSTWVIFYGPTGVEKETI